MLLHRVLTVSRPLLAPNRPSHTLSIPIRPELSPLFAASSKTSQKCAKSDLVTSFSSTKPFRSFALFFTLAEISLVFATLTKKQGGRGGIFFIANFPSRRAPHAPFPFWNDKTSSSCGSAAPLSRSGRSRYHVCGASGVWATTAMLMPRTAKNGCATKEERGCPTGSDRKKRESPALHLRKG